MDYTESLSSARPTEAAPGPRVARQVLVVDVAIRLVLPARSTCMAHSIAVCCYPHKSLRSDAENVRDPVRTLDRDRGIKVPPALLLLHSAVADNVPARSGHQAHLLWWWRDGRGCRVLVPAGVARLAKRLDEKAGQHMAKERAQI